MEIHLVFASLSYKWAYKHAACLVCIYQSALLPTVLEKCLLFIEYKSKLHTLRIFLLLFHRSVLKFTLNSQGVRILSGGIKTGGDGEVRLSVEIPRLSLICNHQKQNKKIKTFKGNIYGDGFSLWKSWPIRSA